MKNTKSIIVAGCARSGLTATMHLLHFGGYPCFGTYPAFEDYEFGNAPYEQAIGKAIKVIDTHLDLPKQGDYYVIRLRRDIKEQAKSTIKFLRAVGFPASMDMRPRIEKSLIRDYKIIDNWAAKQKGNIAIDFEDIINSPSLVLKKISEFIDFNLKEEAINSIVKRDVKCYSGILEFQFIKEALKK